MSADEMNTKPTIETVLERINALDQKLTTELQSLRSEMEKGFRRLDRSFDHLAGELVRLRSDQHELEDRMVKLEGDRR
jgi:hypothetical protein